MGLHILGKSLPLSTQDVYMSTPTREMTSGIIVAPWHYCGIVTNHGSYILHYKRKSCNHFQKCNHYNSMIDCPHKEVITRLALVM